jgi:hypothetical protein
MKTIIRLIALAAMTAALLACQGADDYTPTTDLTTWDSPVLASADVIRTTGDGIYETTANGGYVCSTLNHRYAFTCIATLPDGTAVSSDDPLWEQSFIWTASSSKLTCHGNGLFTLQAGNPGSFDACCLFEEKELFTFNIEAYEPVYRLTGHTAERIRIDGNDLLELSVTIDALNPRTLETADSFNIRCPYREGLDFGNLSVMTAFDCIRNQLWEGCADTVPHGTPARYYLRVKYGEEHWETYGPSGI